MMKKIFNKGLCIVPTPSKIFLKSNLAIVLIMVFFVFIAIPPDYCQAQQKINISGIITDASSGERIPGVNVTVKGTITGGISDAEGKYSILSIDPNAVLVFSFIGYTAIEIPVAGRAMIDVELSSSFTSLDEVVVIGYGTVKKATVTGSISTVKGEALQTSPSINFTNSFAGRLPGLVSVTPSGEPGRDAATLRIRGSNTLNDNSPLIVIDGIANRSMERLNPADIESITILKDASAAIYGAQAANGVILITTKRGTEGKPVVTLNLNQGWSMPTVIPECADAATYATMLNEINYYAGVSPLYTDDEIQKFKDGTDPWKYPNTDWFGTTFKRAASQNYANLSINGGSSSLKYFVSVGTNFQDAIYKNSATNYSQSNFRSNLDGKISDYINLSLDVSGRQENRHYPTVSTGSIFGMLLRGKPNMPAYWPNGLNGPDIEYGQNPVVVTTDQTGYDKDIRYNLETLMKLTVTVPWVKGLSITGNAGFDKNIRNDKLWQTPWYLYTWDGVTMGDDGLPLLSKGKKGLSDPQLTQTMSDGSLITLNTLINYDFKLFNIHNFRFMVGSERISGKSMNFSAFRKYFTSTAIDQLFAGGNLEKDNNGSADVSARMNYFGRFNYDLADKYLFEFVWRYDGSYIFPNEKRFGFFPGISLGWRISDENLSTINYFKIRGSWGQTGNDRITPYQYLSSYGFSTSTSGIYVVNDNVEKKILQELRIPNSNVTWEVANQTNVGFDAQAFKGRLSFSADYFYNLRSKILCTRNASVPGSTGLTLPMENIGEVVNQGFEIQLGWNDNMGKLTYAINANGGYQKNKIKFWDETPGIPDYQKSTGYPMNTSLYYKAIGVFSDVEAVNAYPHWSGARPGDIIFDDVNGDGKIDGLDRVRIYKNNLPTFIGGLTIDLNYGNFYSNIFIQGATGAMRNSYYEMQGEAGNYLVQNADGRWTEDNPNATKPRTWNRYNEYWRNYSNTYWLESTDYIRLKNLEVGYSFNQINSAKYFISGFRIYLSGLNLITIDHLKDFDPESSSDTSYPLNKIYNVGISLTF
jgi:TonB-linked SusC/RagA family outer membrane protein